MKIHELAIIFIIIILPISVVLSAYTQFQIQTINLQTQYDAKLTTSTVDAIKAFQINTADNTMSDLTTSKIRDIEAAISVFRNSVLKNFELSAYTEDEINQYIPALVFTMYDGFYIYTPFKNETGYDELQGVGTEGQSIYGLKPYVNYSCRYKKGSNIDVVITYALDNYVMVQGTINGEYVSFDGYLIDGITVSGDSVSYNGQTIDNETNLIEGIVLEDGNRYDCPYIKVNGTKYYYVEGNSGDASDDRVVYISNGTIRDQYLGDIARQYYENSIRNNNQAKEYYKSAAEFKQKIQDYGLDELKYSDAYEVYNERTNEDGSIEVVYDDTQIWPDNDTVIFKFNEGTNYENNIECARSNFNQHRLAVIRHKIETNLSTAIANYNNYSPAGVNFQMPELSEEDWEHVLNNVSLISFVQGLSIGGKIYNGYSIVNNSETKEVVQEENIYIIGSDDYYHRIGDRYLEESANIRTDIPAGRLKLDFNRLSRTIDDTHTVYYYPLTQLASYDSVITQNNVQTFEDIYIYIDEELDDGNTALAKAFYTALGRERQGSYKFTTNTQ